MGLIRILSCDSVVWAVSLLFVMSDNAPARSPVIKTRIKIAIPVMPSSSYGNSLVSHLDDSKRHLPNRTSPTRKKP